MTFDEYLNSLFSTKELIPKSKEWMFVALDSDEESSSAKRDEILKKHGFARFSPNNSTPLPESTYVGKVFTHDADDLVQKIWDELKQHKLKPTRIFGGKINGWKVINK